LQVVGPVNVPRLILKEQFMKSIVITGSGSGLGRALARRVAADGECVVLLGRTSAKVEAAAKELGGSCYAVACDVGSPDSVRQAFAAIADRTPVIDVLINNAAIYEPFFIKDATDAQISDAVHTNLAGPIYCARAAIPMLKRGSHIINISSETVSVPHAMLSLYQSSKAGLERFGEALRAELEPDGIRVTMVRAGQMMGPDSRLPTNDMDVMRRFAEENFKRGLDLRARPISAFSSAAELIRGLVHLPPDINVGQIVLEAWRA
jgi:meso-butanediol dehydrogenase / (S,S)-butanediol dehydrogenase / diacetyl reductase